MSGFGDRFLQDRSQEEWGEMPEPMSDYNQQEYIISLLKQANMCPLEKDEIEKHVELLTEQEAHVLIIQLSSNQLDPIKSGFSYTLTEVKNRIGKIIKD